MAVVPPPPPPVVPPPPPAPSSPSWWRKALGVVREHFTAFLTTTLLAVLTAFSGCITENVKFGLNRADTRAAKYEALAVSLSDFVFSVEQEWEILRDNRTDLATLKTQHEEYNALITSLRKNEYVYIHWLSRYWSKGRVKEFEEVMQSVREVDSIIHSLNDQFTLIRDKKIDKVPDDRAKAAADQLDVALKTLQARTRTFLQNLQ